MSPPLALGPSDLRSPQHLPFLQTDVQSSHPLPLCGGPTGGRVRPGALNGSVLVTDQPAALWPSGWSRGPSRRHHPRWWTVGGQVAGEGHGHGGPLPMAQGRGPLPAELVRRQERTCRPHPPGPRAARAGRSQPWLPLRGRSGNACQRQPPGSSCPEQSCLGAPGGSCLACVSGRLGSGPALRLP